MKTKRCISFLSDRDSRFYVVPTTKETKFQAWEASVIGGENDEYMDENYESTGEDFFDYRIDSPLGVLGVLALLNPYRRFRQKRARPSRPS
jgi:hypothetical protein